VFGGFLFDRSEIPHDFFDLFTPFPPPPYSEAGHKMDNLENRPGRIAAAVDGLAKRWLNDSLEENRGDPREPVSLLSPLRFQAAADLLSSPLLGRYVRGGIVDHAAGLDRVTVREDLLDPNGRPATVLSIPDLARQRRAVVFDLKRPGAFRIGERESYEFRRFNVFRGTHVARELFVNPRNNDILATRTVLTATENKALARRLKRSGGPQVLEQRVFRRANLKAREDLARRPFSAPAGDSRLDPVQPPG